MNKKDKNIKVSIGIPAYNEEENIKNLLLSLLDQKEDGFKLDSIFITNDQSKDNTVAEIKSIKDKRVVLLDNKIRLGQAESQNKILEYFKADVIVFLNADIKITDDKFIKKIIQPILEDENVAIVSPDTIPLEAKTFFESVINYSVKYKNSIAKSWNSGNNLYLCHGAARAMSKQFVKEFKWNHIVSEDAYSYLYAINKGYNFKFLPDAKVYYRSPNNFTDHKKQSTRFFNTINEFEECFPVDLIKKEYALPKSLVISKSISYLIKNPILFMSYIIVLFRVKISPKNAISNKWEPSTSSKNLN